MTLVELGRYGRNEAHIVVGLLESHGIRALTLDGHVSIAEGSAFFIPVRVMVSAADEAAARAIIATVPNS